MVQELNHDLAFLSQKAERATENDKQVIDDLLDTLRTHLDSCVGMAANMIGVNKSIVVFCKGKKQYIHPEHLPQVPVKSCRNLTFCSV